MSKIKYFLLLGLILAASSSFAACSLLGPKFAGLQVITAETEASIFLNGQYLDETPYVSKELKPGEYTLTIDPKDANLSNWEQQVTLKKGLLTVITWKPGERVETSGGVIYEMEELPDKNKSELSLVTIPDRAIVSLDEQSKDFAPITVKELEPGHHDFEVSLPSYESQKHTLNALAGYRMLVTVKLAKQELAQEKTTQATNSASLDINNEASATSAAELEPVEVLQGSEVLTGPVVLIKPTNFFQAGKEVLRVRDKASNAGKELGFALVGKKYAYLSETTAGWHKIKFEGQVAWVSAQYSEIID